MLGVIFSIFYAKLPQYQKGQSRQNLPPLLLHFATFHTLIHLSYWKVLA